MSEIRVDNITDEAGTGKPGFPNGITATGAALTDPEITGGIYLGGTGSSNYLEDYEEGTWTPSIQGTNSSNLQGWYTKVGDVVHVWCMIDYNGTPSVSYIEGLPFTVRSNSVTGTSHSGFGTGYSDSLGMLHVTPWSGQNYMRIWDTSANDDTIVSDDFIRCGATYQTDS